MTPFLLFPKAKTSAKTSRHGGGGTLTTPTAGQQKARLESRFKEIARSFQDIHTTSEGIEPELVVVFETLQDAISDFAAAAGKIPEMEWVGEIDLEDVQAVDGFSLGPDKQLVCRLYAVMTSKKAMDQILSLWDEWLKDPGKRAQRGYGPFKELFKTLHDVRRWGVEDRLAETGALENWKFFLEHARDSHRFEIELWCRASEGDRKRAFDRTREILEEEGGRAIAQSVNPAIQYHGILAELPAAAIKRTVEKLLSKEYTRMLLSEEVMLFRPHVQGICPTVEAESEALPPLDEEGGPSSDRKPVVALLDGLPLGNHSTYKDLIKIDDPDDYQSQYGSYVEQRHGTAMASLIVQGDLGKTNEKLSRPIYVRPILVPIRLPGSEPTEGLPSGELVVDVVHRALRRIFEEQDSEAKTVKLVNLSFGDPRYVFVRQPSPLARLLDWLAWKYQVLIFVSAGNQRHDIVIPKANAGQLQGSELRAETLKAICGQRPHRRLFSPSEAINVLTVGATHEDAAHAAWPDARVDLLPGYAGPSPISTVCSGFNRSVKPEIMMAGGRQLYYPKPINEPDTTSFSVSPSARSPGMRVASPGPRPLDLDHVVHSRGTSNATALATREAAMAYERLLALKTQEGGNRLSEDYIAVLLKALMVHSASCREATESVLEATLCANGMAAAEKKRLLSHFQGYGTLDPDRLVSCTDQRVTLLGWDTIKCDEGHVFELPLPPSLGGIRTKRRLTVTLAWLSPINPRHRRYRTAYLWTSIDKGNLFPNLRNYDEKMTQRGTVSHRIYEGEKAAVIDQDDKLVVTVSCVGDAGKLSDSVRYGIAVTLEVGEATRLPLYQEIKARVQTQVGVQAQTG